MRDLWDRWLGVGLTTLLAVATLVLLATGRLDLYVNPSSSWFAVAMAVVAIGVGVVGIALPRGAESAHSHDHPPATQQTDSAMTAGSTTSHVAQDSPRAHSLGKLAAVSGGTVASVVVLSAWALPATTLSVDVAISRSSETPALFGGDDTVALAQSGDTRLFGIPEWATVFASTTSPETFRGDSVDLVGFVIEDPSAPDRLLLSRLVITHCAIDAQPAHVPVTLPGWGEDIQVGDWVDVSGTVTVDDGTLMIDPSSVTVVDEPEDPYEY